ncbi:MAG TPA: DUF4286 family protein [Pyrinomonadaceae bacterium]|jgi:hypothetical protein|nr:DUF4286 family protein [Pyrinomonadaceae bacterium]
MALIYEVTVTVAAEDAAEFESYMTAQHIPDVLGTGCFTDALLAKEGSDYRTYYNVDSRDDLDRYIAEHSPRLRCDVIDRFGGRIQISRRILEIVQAFPGK